LVQKHDVDYADLIKENEILSTALENIAYHMSHPNSDLGDGSGVWKCQQFARNILDNKS
jgi:hypothetical protein